MVLIIGAEAVRYGEIRRLALVGLVEQLQEYTADPLVVLGDIVPQVEEVLLSRDAVPALAFQVVRGDAVRIGDSALPYALLVARVVILSRAARAIGAVPIVRGAAVQSGHRVDAGAPVLAALVFLLPRLVADRPQVIVDDRHRPVRQDLAHSHIDPLFIVDRALREAAPSIDSVVVLQPGRSADGNPDRVGAPVLNEGAYHVPNHGQ